MILCSVTVTETDVQVMEHLPRRLHTVEYWNLFFCEQVSLSHYDARLRYSRFVHQSSLIYLTQSSLESCRISSGSSHIITASGEELPVHLLGRQKHASLFPCYTINSMHAPPLSSPAMRRGNGCAYGGLRLRSSIHASQNLRLRLHPSVTQTLSRRCWKLAPVSLQKNHLA